MEYLYYALGAMAVLLLLLIVYVATRPGEFRVTRSGTMKAPPAKVFEQVNNFHNFGNWSPWEKIDPAMKRTFSGAESGVGAEYHWVGNKKVGEGRMTILESRPGELVKMKLQFLKPFKATNTAEYTFVPEANGTRMTWSMYGTKNFFMKAFGLLMNMDKLVGGDFERGIANMKTLMEAK